MNIIILLIIFSLLVALIFLGAFIWAVRSGQYDDTHSPSVRMLIDHSREVSKNEKQQKKKSRDQE